MKDNDSKKANDETTSADIRLLALKADDAQRQGEAARERARLAKTRLKKARKAFKAAKKLAKRARKAAKAAAKGLMKAQATLLAAPAKRVVKPKAAVKPQARKTKQPATQNVRGSQLNRGTTLAPVSKPASEANLVVPPIRTGTTPAPENTSKQSE